MEKKWALENGLTAYHYPNPHLHGFCLSLNVKGGSMCEPDELCGVTHFIEHIVFRNIDRAMGGGLYRTLDRLGLTFNATTYREFVEFTVNGAREHFPEAVELLLKVFLPINLPASEIDLERRRIKAEIREDGERTSLDHFTRQITWAGTPLTRSILGTAATLNRMGLQVLNREHRRLLAAENCFFYATGCVSEADMQMLAQRAGALELAHAQTTFDNIAPVPEGFGRRNAQVAVKNSTYTLVRFSFDVDTSRFRENETSLLADILFSGDTGKMYLELSENSGLVYDVDHVFERYRNIGVMHFQYEVRRDRLMESVECTIAVLKSMKSGLTDELICARAPYTENAMLLFDDACEFNATWAYESHILRSGYPDIPARRSDYASVTIERIMEIARAVFVPRNLVLTLKGERGRTSEEQLRGALMNL